MEKSYFIITSCTAPYGENSLVDHISATLVSLNLCRLTKIITVAANFSESSSDNVQLLFGSFFVLSHPALVLGQVRNEVS